VTNKLTVHTGKSVWFGCPPQYSTTLPKTHEEVELITAVGDLWSQAGHGVWNNPMHDWLDWYCYRITTVKIHMCGIPLLTSSSCSPWILGCSWIKVLLLLHPSVIHGIKMPGLLHNLYCKW